MIMLTKERTWLLTWETRQYFDDSDVVRVEHHSKTFSDEVDALAAYVSECEFEGYCVHLEEIVW